MGKHEPFYLYSTQFVGKWLEKNEKVEILIDIVRKKSAVFRIHAQPDLDGGIAFAAWSVKQDTVIVLFPDRRKLNGSRTMQTEHDTAGGVSPF